MESGSNKYAQTNNTFGCLPCPTVCDGAVTNHVHSLPVWRRNSTCRVHKQISVHPCLMWCKKSNFYQENITKMLPIFQNFPVLFLVVWSLCLHSERLCLHRKYSLKRAKTFEIQMSQSHDEKKNKVLSTLCRFAVHKILLFVGVCLEIIILMTSLMSVDQWECATRIINQWDLTCVRKREASELRHQVLGSGQCVYWMTLYFWLIKMAPIAVPWLDKNVEVVM